MSGSADPRLSSAPALRNRAPIAAALRQMLPAKGTVLELASGSGEHVVWFAAQFPNLSWQPTDPDPRARASIAAHTADSGLANIRPPLALDASAPETWPIAQACAILAINLIHISPPAATRGLFAGAARVLGGGPVILYGPYLEAEVETTASNLQFDAWLKARNPDFGLRDRRWVEAIAAAHGFRLGQRTPMPANNLLLLFQPD